MREQELKEYRLSIDEQIKNIQEINKKKWQEQSTHIVKDFEAKLQHLGQFVKKELKMTIEKYDQLTSIVFKSEYQPYSAKLELEYPLEDVANSIVIGGVLARLRPSFMMLGEAWWHLEAGPALCRFDLQARDIDSTTAQEQTQFSTSFLLILYFTQTLGLRTRQYVQFQWCPLMLQINNLIEWFHYSARLIQNINLVLVAITNTYFNKEMLDKMISTFNKPLNDYTPILNEHGESKLAEYILDHGWKFSLKELNQNAITMEHIIQNTRRKI